ncbi:MAG: heavy metal translocating P-type ATPase [Thiohalocapsa sp.]
MIMLGGLMTGGLLYSGVRARKYITRSRIERLKGARSSGSVADDREISSEALSPGEKTYPITVATLGLTLAGRFLYAPLTLIGLAGMLYLLVPTFIMAYRDLARKRRFTSIVLEAVVLPGTLIAGHFLAVAFAFWFLYFALNNVAKAKWKANQNLANVFVAPSRQAVYVMRDGVELESTLKDLRLGDILVLDAGQIVPVDGTITEGNASIDQHMLTGEAQPMEKLPGDPVLAATLLLEGRIKVRVERTGSETLANQSTQILTQMTRFTDDLELRGTDAADRLALPLFLMGSATGLFLGAGRGLAITWSPLDDALYVAGPLNVLNFLNISLRRNILVKDGRALEVLRRVDTFVFDKTGTLTTDVPEVIAVHACTGLSRTEILRYAAAAEQKQLHPIALAILAAASTDGIDLPAVEGESIKKGFGVTVSIEAQTVSIGSARFMDLLSLEVPEALQSVEERCQADGHSVIHVAIDHTIIGAIELHASVRAEAAQTVSRLRKQGYRVCIISGDNERPTQHLARQLGIDCCFAETLPQDKGKLIQAMQQAGRVVCYVGDGINDAIALKQAEVSVSLRGASTIATDTAQIVLMNQDLEQLLELIAIAKRLERNFKASVLLGAAPTVGIIAGVYLFQLSLASAVTLYLAGVGLSMTQAMLPLLRERNVDRRTDNRRDGRNGRNGRDHPTS